MLLLNDDILLEIWTRYVYNKIECIRNIELINKLFVCKKLYNIYKINKNKILKWRCNLLHISEINYKVCNIHDNIGLEYVKKVLGQIEKYKILHEIPNHENLSVHNFHSFHVGNYIHCPYLKKNEIFVKNLLKKFNLQIVRYCCGGNGCELRQIKN